MRTVAGLTSFLVWKLSFALLENGLNAVFNQCMQYIII
jgi:hypothetical protein